jgi:hypothetical protein
MARRIQPRARELLSRGQKPGGGVITEAQLAVLPDPIRRYLEYARVVGKEPIRTVRLKQRGAMRLAEGKGWLPLVAEQYVTNNPPAFLWHGTIQPFPLVSVSATDEFSDGHGTMAIKALSFIPLGTARGPEMDQGELLRYLGETAWFPTALVSGNIQWEDIDASSATATVSAGRTRASGIIHVDEQGRCTHFTAERYREERKRQMLRSWTGRWDDYREINGFCIPTRAEAIWTLESGDFSYFRGEVTEIGYDRLTGPAGKEGTGR